MIYTVKHSKNSLKNSLKKVKKHTDLKFAHNILLVVLYIHANFQTNPFNSHWKKCKRVWKFIRFWLWRTDEQTDLHALNNFSSSIGKLSFKKNCMSLALIVLEKKLFTRTRTPTPQSDDIMSADWQVSWHKNHTKTVFIYRFN